MTCLSENTLVALAGGSLEGPAALDAERHLDECPECRRWLAEAIKAQRPDLGLAETLAPDTAPARSRHGPLPPLSKGTLVGTRPDGAPGRYEILSRLGAGGMGVVWAARDTLLERSVALKLLQSHGPEHEARLLREARMMAQVTHPNLTAVHDAGVWEQRVYLTMELLEGGTLRAFLREQHASGAPDQRAILARFVQAGRGLSAAHAAGLVHRDFKPENVILDRDGVPHVTDFGLARAVQDGVVPGPASPSPSPVAPVADEAITRTGTAVGTPAYMAPEQHRGAVGDARTDQFAFAVALHEALYQVRPFPGRTPEELARSASAGEVVSAPPGARVPARVRRVLLRALSPAPADRFPSMDALLEALLRAQALPRRLAKVAVGLACLLVLGTGAGLGARWVRHAPCRGSEAQLAGAWDDPTRSRLAAAFGATGKPFAQAAWERTERTLAAYANRLVEVRSGACEEGTREQLEQRLECLRVRLGALRSLTDALAGADAAVVERAPLAAASLPSPDDCRQPQTAEPQAWDPELRARAREVGSRLEAVRALQSTGRYPAALAAMSPILAELPGLGQGALVARAHLLHAELLAATGDHAGSDAAIQAGLVAAESAGADDLRAELRLLAARGAERTGDYARNQRELAQAAAILDRLPSASRLRAELTVQQGVALYARGDAAAALAKLRHALGLFEDARASDAPSALLARRGLATALMDLGDFGAGGREILDLQQRQTRLLGPEHPALASTVSMVGGYELMGRGDPQAALGHFQHALALLEASLGQGNPATAESHNMIGEALRRLGRFAEAEQSYRRFEKLVVQSGVPNHPDLGRAWNNLGVTRRAERRFAEALELHHRAIGSWESVLGRDHPLLAMAHYELAETLRESGRAKESLDSYQRALAVQRASRPADHPDEAFVLTGTGRALLAVGDLALAREPLEHAARLREPLVLDPVDKARTLLALSQTLATSDRERAQVLARRALELAEGAPPSFERESLRVEARGSALLPPSR